MMWSAKSLKERYKEWKEQRQLEKAQREHEKEYGMKKPSIKDIRKWEEWEKERDK